MNPLKKQRSLTYSQYSPPNRQQLSLNDCLPKLIDLMKRLSRFQWQWAGRAGTRVRFVRRSLKVSLWNGEWVGDGRAVQLSAFGASLKQAGLCEVAVFEVSEMRWQAKAGKRAHLFLGDPTILCFSDEIAWCRIYSERMLLTMSVSCVKAGQMGQNGGWGEASAQTEGCETLHEKRRGECTKKPWRF